MAWTQTLGTALHRCGHGVVLTIASFSALFCSAACLHACVLVPPVAGVKLPRVPPLPTSQPTPCRPVHWIGPPCSTIRGVALRFTVHYFMGVLHRIKEVAAILDIAHNCNYRYTPHEIDPNVCLIFISLALVCRLVRWTCPRSSVTSRRLRPS